MKIHTPIKEIHKSRTIVCVAGCMHSGSSMTARILNICGMNLGPDINLLDADSAGPAGYWENVNLLRGNILIMQSFDENTNTFIQQNSNAQVVNVSMEDAYKKANNFLNEELKGNFVGWKDPNNCLTIGFWKKAVSSLKIVLCLRNPFDVAKSISESRQHKLNFQDGLLIWERYNSNVINQISSKDLIIIQYENYFINPEQEIRTLLGKLEVNNKNPKIIKLASAAVHPSLWHYRDVVVPEIDKTMIQRVDRLYRKIKSLT